MANLLNSRNLALSLSGLALLSFLGRTFIDYGYVFPEYKLGMPDLLPVTLVVLAFYGGWLLALMSAARGSRRGWIIVQVYNGFLLIFGLSTLATSLCPSPCGTAWPLGEMLIWSNLLIGVVALLVVVLQFRSSSNRSLPQTA